MIFALQNAFPKELISEIRETVISIEDTSKYNFGCAYNRNGKTINFSHPNLKELDIKINNFIGDFSERFVTPHFCPSFSSSDTGYEYHKYGIGQGCLVHSDEEFIFPGNTNSSLLRFATIVIHLNTVNEGGETVFPNQNKNFKTIEGQILVFPPYNGYKHYVTPCIDVEREILMTWFVYNGLNVVKI